MEVCQTTIMCLLMIGKFGFQHDFICLNKNVIQMGRD